MLRIYIGLLLLLLLHHHHHHHISIVFFYHHHHRISIFLFYHHHHISIFPSKSFYKNRKLPQLVQFVSMSQVVKNNRGFLQLLAVCPAHQRHFLLRTATPKQPRGLVQVLYNVLKEYILMPEHGGAKPPHRCCIRGAQLITGKIQYGGQFTICRKPSTTNSTLQT